MGAKTDISWTNATWNPLRGCSRVSEGCRHCYAEVMAGRFCGPSETYAGVAKRTPKGARWTGKVRFIPEKLAQPVRWTKPRLIFVNSMSDLFHETVPFETVAAIFGVMAAAQHHTFQVLTKRPERMLEFFRWLDARCRDDSKFGAHLTDQGDRHFTEVHHFALQLENEHPELGETLNTKGPNDVKRVWPRPNVWLGVSVEDDAAAIERIPILVECPAAVRWISAEPLLGPLDLAWAFDPMGADCGAEMPCDCCSWIGRWPRDDNGWPVSIDWVVVGGESGAGARPMHADWVREIRDTCAEHNVPFHFKQWGRWVPRDHLTSAMALGRSNITGHNWPDGEHSLELTKRRTGNVLDGETHLTWPEGATAEGT